MDLKVIRDRIGAIDSEMAELFKQRMEAVKEVAQYKSERGLAIEDRERELKLIESKSELIEDEEIKALYVNFLQSVMDISKGYQNRLMNGLRIACTGEKETSGYLASESIYPQGNITSFEYFEEAYKAVENGVCDVAVLPLENSYKGEVGQVYDLIFSGSLYVNDIYAIENNGSTTRYAVLSRVRNEQEGSSDSEAFLIMFTVKDEIGGLAKAINIISAYDYNMRVMRSRPMKDLPWHYYFYAELEGSVDSESGERITRALHASCPIVKIAGHFKEDRDILVGNAGR